MNNRLTSFSNDEWIRQKTNIPLAQCAPNVTSPCNMRPPYRSLEKFNDDPIAKNNKPEASRFNSQYNERPARQAFCATVNFPPNQNAIYSPRLTHQTSLPSHQISQDLQGSRYEKPISGDFPTCNQFTKIPCNLKSAQNFENNANTYFPISNDRMQSINYNTSGQQLAYRPPSANQIEVTRTPNSNNNFTRQPPKPNMPEFMERSLQLNSNASTLIRPQLASNVSSFQRPPFSQGFSSPDIVQHPFSQGFGNPDAIRHAIPVGSGNMNPIRQSSIPGYGNLNLKQGPSSLDSSNPEFKHQSFVPDSGNLGSRQPSPLDFNKPDVIRQPPPLGPIMQPPSNNICIPGGNFACPLQIPPALPTSVNPFTSLKHDSCFNILSGPNLSMPPPSVNQDWLEENNINQFLQKFTQKEKKSSKYDLTVTEFRNRLRDAFVTVRELMELKASLSSLLYADKNEWNKKLEEASLYKDKLTKACDFLSEPKVSLCIQERLKNRKIKRELKKKIKANKMKEKTKKLAVREELHQTLDKWIESIKEKNSKLEREAEMKKEADSILAEVRRKIHEAKRTIEKIKVFEKLRSARHANAVKKGLFLPDHDQRFKIRISELKATLYRQLSDYESEEKALKVMLEAEQEGQLEEEALWRIKKLKTAQQRRQKNIIVSLFGNEEEPTEDDPIYLFHQFQNSGNKSIENLVQIRHHWDLHLNKDGETVPSQWVVPVPPSSAAWEIALES